MPRIILVVDPACCRPAPSSHLALILDQAVAVIPLCRNYRQNTVTLHVCTQAVRARIRALRERHHVAREPSLVSAPLLIDCDGEAEGGGSGTGACAVAEGGGGSRWRAEKGQQPGGGSGHVGALLGELA